MKVHCFFAPKWKKVLVRSAIERLAEMFYFEFMQIMKDGRQIKRCKNCGKYFVLRDNRKREYCERPFKDGIISGDEMLNIIREGYI